MRRGLLCNRVSKDGFTLIELLIVVAIIAILAAIAVPNFLEAQTRAKISRGLTDMRTIGVATEMYTVDEGSPPLGHGYLKVVGPSNVKSLGLHGRNKYAQTRLTTPISYLSTLLLDPFTYVLGPQNEKGEYLGLENGKGNLFVFQSHSKIPGRTLSQMNSMASFKKGKLLARGFHWSYHSLGPSTVNNGAVYTMLDGGSNCVVYNASNGTKSVGWLVRTNQGNLVTKPLK